MSTGLWKLRQSYIASELWSWIFNFTALISLSLSSLLGYLVTECVFLSV